MENRVILLRLADLAENEEAIRAAVDPLRLAKADRLIKHEDRLRSLGGALLLEAFTAPDLIFYGPSRKPYKDQPPFFNLSHSGDFVGIALSDEHEVGLDIEKPRPYDSALADRCFGPEERPFVSDEATFLFRWTLKEAAYKFFGNGLRDPLHQQVILEDGGRCSVATVPLCYQSLRVEEYSLSVVSDVPPAMSVEIKTVGDLLASIKDK